MRGSAALRVDSVDGRAFASDVRSEPPFAIRRTGDRFLIVGSAAAPVRGDQLCVTIEVAVDTVADIGTVAATMVWPGPAIAPSRLTTVIRVDDGGHLRWCPEPVVSVEGSSHIAETLVELGAGSTCEIVEHYSLGRHHEPSGSLTTVLRVTRSGRPIIHHGERFGPQLAGAGSVSGVAAARHVIAAAFVGRPSGSPRVAPHDPLDLVRGAAAWLPVGDDAAVALATGSDRSHATRLLASVVPLPAR